MLQKKTRIEFLDGLRGVAIIFVILFHTYARWPLIMPFGDAYVKFPLLKYGWLGVQLFFLISGFVILMTLEKSKHFLHFLRKRWLRLFPAMFISTILLFLSASWLYERPEGNPELIDCLPGLLFIEPIWFKFITGFIAKALDGAFWSLFVEVKFYVIFGLFYFLLGRNKAIMALFFCYMLWLVDLLLIKLLGTSLIPAWLQKATLRCSFNHMGWFVSGSLAYLYYTSSNMRYYWAAIITGVLASISLAGEGKAATIAGLIMLALFLATIHFNKFKYFFAQKGLLLIGFISYPLYLIHQNVIVSLTIKMGRHFNFIPGIALPWLPILLVAVVAFVIAKYFEPAFQSLISTKKIITQEKSEDNSILNGNSRST